MATVVSPVLSSSGKAASTGRELQLHVSHSLHRCPAEYCQHQRNGSMSLKGVFHLVAA